MSTEKAFWRCSVPRRIIAKRTTGADGMTFTRGPLAVVAEGRKNSIQTVVMAIMRCYTPYELDHRIIFGHHHLQRTVDEYVGYYNRWRPHRSLGQIAPCPDVKDLPTEPSRRLVAKSVLSGLHHVYQWAA